MTNVTEITPIRRTPKFSGVMIEHAANILCKAGTNVTLLDEDGLSQVSPCYLVDYLKANWGSKVRRPLTHEQWGALGYVAQNLIWIEDDLEQDEVSIH